MERGWCVTAQEEKSGFRHDWPVWVPFVQTAGLLLLHGAFPFFLSRLSDRHGWSAGQPALWNLTGLLPIACGIAIIIWILALHGEQAPRHGWRVEKTPFEPPRYLIANGPYRYSRNPMYLSHLSIWSGWMLFYGSVTVMLGVLVLWMVLAFIIVPYEERGLARALGESYLRYQNQVPRWFGRRSD
jgi:protein-S-isoprenylcysteine O-methyltransferase Ste14